MSLEDCIRKIRQAGGEELSEEAVLDLLGSLNTRLEFLRAHENLAGVENEMLRTADDYAEQLIEAAQIAKRNRYFNVIAKADLLSAAREADRLVGDPSMGLEARSVGVNAPLSGGRRSVDSRGKALEAQYLGGLIADMRQQDLLPDFNSRRLERELAVELEQLTLPDGRPGISGSSQARAMAVIVDKYRKMAVARENRAGAWIRPLPGYITRQTHDMAKLRRAGFEQWRDTILPLLDQRKTFADVEDTDAFLRGTYDALSSGVHMRAMGEAENDLEFAFTGPGNLAKRISQHRKLHFTSADDWLAYNRDFGTGSLTDSLVFEFRRAAENTALMEVYGPNPRAMFDTVKRELEQEFRSDPKKVDRLRRESLNHQFAEIDGTARIPINPSAAHVGAAVRAIQSMAKLGGAALSAMSDLVFIAAARKHQGRNLLSAWGDTYRGFLDGIAQGDQRRVADLIGTGLEGQIGDIGARFSAEDNIPGMLSKAQQRFFKLNLLGPWTDAHKRGMGLMLARDLAMQKGSTFDQLPGATRSLLQRYGVSSQLWDVARQATEVAADGREYLMPEAIRKLPDSVFGDVNPRQARRFKDNLETAIRAYYVDQADFASPTPGARERAILRRGTQPGTVVGEAMRFVTQFKAFPITVLSKPMGRDIYSRGARSMGGALMRGEGDVLGLVHMMVGTTVLGYLAQSSKELAKGRQPRDPGQVATWQAAMLQGGGLGIYGDFLLGESNRFGRSLLDTLAGPTLGTLSDIDEIRARYMAGDDASAQAFNTILANTPGMNLPYLRIGLDYLFLYAIQEALNPGYLRRTERRIERENNQQFILPPSQVVK